MLADSNNIFNDLGESNLTYLIEKLPQITCSQDDLHLFIRKALIRRQFSFEKMEILNSTLSYIKNVGPPDDSFRADLKYALKEAPQKEWKEAIQKFLNEY